MRSGRILDDDLFNLNSSSREKVEHSFNRIFNEFSYLVFYVSFKITRNEKDAEDIMNETFLKFYEERDNIKNHKGIKYYLTTTSKNLSINLVNKNNKTILYDENRFTSEIKNDYFSDYIDKFKYFLDEEEIDIVVYHILYDFTFKEIARYKNTSVNSISSKYKRIMSKIKSHFKGAKYL